MCKVMEMVTDYGTKGLELYFDGKPGAEVLDDLKAGGYRWHRVKKCWYHRDTPEARAIAERYGSGTPEQNGNSLAPAERKAPAKKRILSLWERTRTDSLHPYGGGNPLVKEFVEQARKGGGCWDKYAAAWCRKHLRERFPEMKFSVTSGGAGYLMNMDIEILSGPYPMTVKKGNPEAYNFWEREDRNAPGPQLEAVLDYCKALHDSFDADDGDHYADYGARHDLYGDAKIAYNYTATEPTPEQLAEMAAFEQAKAEDEARKRAEEEARWEEEERKREEERKIWEQKEKEAEQAAAEILEHVETVDLPEAEQLAVLDLVQGIGKENTLQEAKERAAERLKEETEKGREPGEVLREAIISRKVLFTSRELFEKFSEMFLRDWPFLNGFGGTGWEDDRLGPDGYKTYLQLTEEQRKTVHTFEVNCVGVYLDGVLQYVIDPQGYNYARYVMIPLPYLNSEGPETEAEADELPAPEYLEECRKANEKKSPFYIPAALSEQLERANLQPGDPVTVLWSDGWMMAHLQRGELVEIRQTDKGGATLDYIPEGKRKPRRIYFKGRGEDLAIYLGILPSVPEQLTREELPSSVEGVTAYRSLTVGTASREFVRKAIQYYQEQGYPPAVDTVAK